MNGRRKSWRDKLGVPETVVLYRTPARWRYALYFSGPHGVADGSLAHPPFDSTSDEAQAAALAKAEEVAGRPLTISWRMSEEPGWWTGAVSTEPVEPANPAAD